MTISSGADECIVNRFGYHELRNKPSADELKNYYADKYYQASLSSYSANYNEAERTYFKNKLEQKYLVADRYLLERKGLSRRFLDIGAGEGWALKFFQEKGWNCTGLDYSSHGCTTHNPECVPLLITGDIYDSMERLIASPQDRFDLILLDNVLEHVLDPSALLETLSKLGAPGCVLIIEVPNDFSELQIYALESGRISRPFWVAVPDHISYFNKDGLCALARENGWSERHIMADFPIDFNLFNQASNYIENKEAGKRCHEQRVIIENLMHAVSPEKAVAFYESLADLNMGRQIIAYFVSKEKVDE
jgi:2-polyprenyl-3-methyl-5-hydroxy-6-metoxy-1,4-benzoquinol methylase